MRPDSIDEAWRHLVNALGEVKKTLPKSKNSPQDIYFAFLLVNIWIGGGMGLPGTLACETFEESLVLEAVSRRGAILRTIKAQEDGESSDSILRHISSFDADLASDERDRLHGNYAVTMVLLRARLDRDARPRVAQAHYRAAIEWNSRGGTRKRGGHVPGTVARSEWEILERQRTEL